MTATSGNPWDLTLDVLRIGAQTIISDGSGNASVALGAFTGNETGAGSITSGSMNLAALATLSNAERGGHRSQLALQPVDHRGALGHRHRRSRRSVTLNFIFTASASAVDPDRRRASRPTKPRCAWASTARFPSFTADDYPGAGLRDPSTDGIFVRFQLTEVPEPGTARAAGPRAARARPPAARARRR